jgi:anti-anti-sigma factor
MELSVHENQGVTVVMVSGEMDAGNSTQLGEELDHLLTEGSRKLVIDLGKVGFMNSSGLWRYFPGGPAASSPSGLPVEPP